MNYQENYRARFCSAKEAVHYIKPGEAIITPISPGEPPALLELCDGLLLAVGNLIPKFSEEV